MDRGLPAIVTILSFICFVPLFIWLFGLLTLWAWNTVIAGVFHGPTIGVWAAIGINVLIGLIGSIFRRK